MVEPVAETKRSTWWGKYRVLLFFALGLLAVDAVIAHYKSLWRSYESHPYRDRLEACRQQRFDIIVLGSSPALYGIDPNLLVGMRRDGTVLESAFDLAFPLATTAEVYHAVEHGLAAPPRLFVYGITATDINDDRVVPQSPRELMDARDVVRWCRERPESTWWAVRNYGGERLTGAWKLMQYRDGIRLWAADKVENLWPGLCPEVAAEARAARERRESLRGSNGFQSPEPTPDFRLDCLKAAGKVEDTFSFLENYHVGVYLVYLHRLLDWAEIHHVPIVLVDMPVSADLDQRICPQAFATFRAALAEVERKRAVRILRPTREEVGLTDADFADVVHLNQSGAKRLTTWLRRELADE